MTLEELIRDEKEESRREGLKEGTLNTSKELIWAFLKRFGAIPEELKDKINALDNEDSLKLLVQKAAGIDSLKAFSKEVDGLLQK